MAERCWFEVASFETEHFNRETLPSKVSQSPTQNHVDCSHVGQQKTILQRAGAST
jgi:hypothetical protein